MLVQKGVTYTTSGDDADHDMAYIRKTDRKSLNFRRLVKCDSAQQVLDTSEHSQSQADQVKLGVDEDWAPNAKPPPP